MNRVAIERFGSASDWSRTRAFSIPDSFVGMIRVNLAGREPAGIVEPGAEYEETVAELENDLLALATRAPARGRSSGSRECGRPMAARRTAMPRSCGDLRGPRTPAAGARTPAGDHPSAQALVGCPQRALGPRCDLWRGPRPDPLPGRRADDPVADGRPGPYAASLTTSSSSTSGSSSITATSSTAASGLEHGERKGDRHRRRSPLPSRKASW